MLSLQKAMCSGILALLWRRTNPLTRVRLGSKDKFGYGGIDTINPIVSRGEALLKPIKYVSMSNFHFLISRLNFVVGQF